MKQLEGELKVRLFNRGSRGVTLTADGEVLYEHVRSAMSMLESGESKLAQSLTLEAGKLTIGASETVTAQYLLPYLETASTPVHWQWLHSLFHLHEHLIQNDCGYNSGSILFDSLQTDCAPYF